MVSKIADILKARIAELTWIERFGGLCVQAIRSDFKNDGTGNMVKIGDQIYPVACDVNAEKCWEDGKYKYFMPDASLSAVAFFVDNGGVDFVSTEGPKQARLRMKFNLKFLCWVNLAKLGQTDCNLSGVVAPYVIAKLHGPQTGTDVLKAVNVTQIRQLIKLPSMFAPFTFEKDGANKGLFLYPYNYFGLSISGTFDIEKNCLPPLFPDLEFTDPACKTN